jgi:3-phosphoshikimate 1-carboxyvinyltransferase
MIEITPLKKPFSASVCLPGSKSLTNRVLLLAALAKGQSTFQNFYLSDDTEAMVEALRALGVVIEIENNQAVVWGCEGEFPNRFAKIFTRDSGTVTRFMLPVLAAQKEGEFYLSASPRMSARPIQPLLTAIQSLGAEVDCQGLPLVLKSHGIRAAESLVVPVNESSQFLSGLLMASSLAHSSLNFIASHNQSYVKMTVEILKQFGQEIVVRERRDGTKQFLTTPGVLSPLNNYVIEPDVSTASYFFAAAALTQSQVEVEGLTRQSLQSDIQFLCVLEEMGARVEETSHSIRLIGPEKLKGVSVNMRHFSDTFMTLAAIASFADSPTEIRGISHTRLQESDRIHAIAANLRALGGKVEVLDDGLRIFPSALQEGEIASFGDHRIAMAMALIGLKIPGLIIKGEECVKKTCPDYFERLSRL